MFSSLMLPSLLLLLFLLLLFYLTALLEMLSKTSCLYCWSSSFPGHAKNVRCICKKCHRAKKGKVLGEEKTLRNINSQSTGSGSSCLKRIVITVNVYQFIGLFVCYLASSTGQSFSPFCKIFVVVIFSLSQCLLWLCSVSL